MAGAITETISVDAGPAVAGLREFTDALEQAAAKYADLEAKMSKGLGGGASAAGADKMAAAMDKAAASVGAAVDKINASMEKVGAAADGAAAGIGRLDEAAGTAGASLDEAAAGADAAAAASDRLAASADAAGAGLERQAVAGKSGAEAAASGGKFWKGLGTVMLGAGVAAGYGIDKAMKFQSQMLLLHTQAGVSVKDTQAMSKGVLQISTQTGQSLTGLSESAYHVASNMASMGATVPQMLGAVKIAAEGASVGHSNLVDTTNAMTAAIASGIPGVKNYQQAMGVLNATVGSGDMSMQDLAEAFGGGMVATVKGYGLTLKDVGAATAVFGDNNIRGAKAGTDLRMAVQALAVPMKTAPLKEYGLTMSTLAKDMQQGGLTKALDDLTARFKKAGLTGKTEGEAITSLFGKKAGSGIAVLLEQMDRYHSKLPLLTKDANNFGQAWAATQATPAQKFKELTAGLQASAVGFGTELLPAFSGAVGFADRLLADINGSKGGARDLAVAFGGIAALFTANKLVSGIGSAVKTAQAGLRGVGTISEVLHIPGLSGLSNIGKGATGAAALDASAANLDGAAEALNGAAAKLGGAGGLGGTAGKVGGAAGAGEAAAAGTAGETVGLSAGMLAAPVLGAGLGLALGIYLNKYHAEDHPAPAGQLGPHAPAAVSSPAWKQYDQAASAPAKMAAPDLSALAQAKGKAAQAAAGIHAAAESPLQKPVKAAAPDLAAYAQAKGKAAADGAAIDAGLASGITGNEGAAIAAAKGVAAAVTAALSSALQVKSPSKVTQAIGASTAQGLVVGLQGGTAAVNAAATALGKNVAKAADVNTINSTVTKLIGYAPHDTALTKLLKADNTKLVTLANQRAALEAQITDSQQIAQQALSNANITGAGSYTPADVTSGGPLAASATISGMQSMAADQKAFAQQIGQLKSMGLNATSLNQIVQSGASSGLPVAQGLTSGGKGGIQQINQLEAQIHASAAKLGDEGAGPMYTAGVQAGQGLAQGIKASLGSVDAAMKALSTAMVADLKKDLKISSPSQVFAGFGLAIPQGLAVGVDAGTPVAEAAVGRMGSRAAGAFHPGYTGGGGGSGGGSGGGGGTVINVTVQGSVTTENDLLTKLQGLQLKRANANWQGGWKLPGRAT